MTIPASRELPQPRRAPAAPRADRRRPIHVIVVAGLSTAAYALSLAAVTALQVGQDRALVAAREPVQRAIDRLARSDDDVQDALNNARGLYAQGTDRYRTVNLQLGDLHVNLRSLAGLLNKIEGTAARMPSALNLPSVPQRPATPQAPPPKSHAQTGASGGG
jgi:hypothetical protein